MIPRYAKAATRGLSRVRFYQSRYPLPMRTAHQELKAAVIARMKAELVRLHALTPATSKG